MKSSPQSMMTTALACDEVAGPSGPSTTGQWACPTAHSVWSAQPNSRRRAKVPSARIVRKQTSPTPPPPPAFTGVPTDVTF